MVIMSRVRALVVASHPGPCLAITALATLLAAQAAPHGAGPVLTAPAMLAGQFSVGWSNDALDSERDAAARRSDKPIAAGQISKRAVWVAAIVSLVAALAMSLAIGPATLAVNALIIAAAWAYNLGLKSTLASGLMYIAGFGPIPAYATSTLPGHPLPRWWVTAAAAAIGLGAHFANVLPDLAGDQPPGSGDCPSGSRPAGAAGPSARWPSPCCSVPPRHSLSRHPRHASGSRSRASRSPACSRSCARAAAAGSRSSPRSAWLP